MTNEKLTYVEKPRTPCDLGGWLHCSQDCGRLHDKEFPHYIAKPLVINTVEDLLRFYWDWCPRDG